MGRRKWGAFPVRGAQAVRDVVPTLEHVLETGIDDDGMRIGGRALRVMGRK